MQTDQEVQGFRPWMESNEGLAAILEELRAARSLDGGVRMAALPGGGLVVLGMACKEGPESIIASIHDWAAGFRITLPSLNGSGPFSSVPMASEASAIAAVRSLASSFSALGYPAHLEDFSRGGRCYQEGLDPLLPISLNLHQPALSDLVRAASDAAENGLPRRSPYALDPNTTQDGLPVYDLRVPADAFTGLMEAIGRSAEKTQALLLERAAIGGPTHLILVDGVREDRVYLTWSMGPGGVVSQEVSAADTTQVSAAPDFLAERAPAERSKLN